MFDLPRYAFSNENPANRLSQSRRVDMQRASEAGDEIATQAVFRTAVSERSEDFRLGKGRRRRTAFEQRRLR